MRVTYALSQSVLPVKQDATVDLLLTFRSDAADGGQARRPLNLSLVIDRSGSMSGQPLQYAIQAAELLVRQLGPCDTLSVVVYDDTVDTIIAPQTVTDADAICETIRKVRARGSTNLHGGWLQGCQYVLQRRGEPAIHRVLLLTDGQANVGVTEPRELIAEGRTQREKGVPTTTLGFGSGFNEDLLIGIAEAGGGNFYFIQTPQDATQVFQIEGESLASLAAQNLAVTLTPAERSGVQIGTVLNGWPAAPTGAGVQVMVGNVHAGEDKVLAVELRAPARPRAAKNLPLVDVTYRYDPMADVATQEGRLAVTGVVGTVAQPADLGILRQAARLRIARAKELAVEQADAGNFKEAAALLHQAAENLRGQGLDDELEIAEEVAQLDYFADRMSRKTFDAGTRKEMRDQSYQGRTRNRADLTARGGSGGSAAGLETTDSPAGGVELICVKGAGKLRVHAASEGYDPMLDVVIPRAVREAGVRYVADGLELARTGSYYRVLGKVRRLKGGVVGATSLGGGPDPLALEELFKGGESWLPLLKPTIEAQSQAATFIGPGRPPGIVPVRELTFQALKPNPPEKWNVVVFGQNPYPRAESATGIAMFDNTFAHWKDSQFGRVTSIRCIIKAAVMSKHGIPKATPIANIRALLAKENTVQPPEWFQAMLTQGVLLLNASLTASSDGKLSTDQHTAFWRPVAEKIVEEILGSKEKADDRHKGVVFAWWGTHAKTLRRVVERLQKKHPGVPVKHIDHPNPAAQGDIFCDGDHFGKVNQALHSLGMDEVDWLPSVGWNKAAGEADRMGDFIARTMELHKFYLERLQEVKDEGKAVLAPIVGVLDSPLLSFADALAPVVALHPGMDFFVKQSLAFGQKAAGNGGTDAAGLTAHEAAGLYLYTTESGFYRELNAVLRYPDRVRVAPYFGYLRLMLSALAKITGYKGDLYRGVAEDMRAQYPRDATVTWWGVSSCTAKRSVATGFLGGSGKRTLFEVKPALAVNIKAYSAFTGEEEYLLMPGTQLKVVDVKAEASGFCTIKLEEQAGQRQVS